MRHIEAVFIDRDGTIGGNGHFVHPKDFVPYPGSLKAFELLKEAGIKMFSFTNQHRISKGQAKIQDFIDEFQSYGFTDTFVCPHEMQAKCQCQKPRPGLLFQAADKYQLNLANCYVIGDVGTDILAGHQAGCKTILVKTGWGKASLSDYKYIWADIEATHICDNLYQAVSYILEDKDE